MKTPTLPTGSRAAFRRRAAGFSLLELLLVLLVIGLVISITYPSMSRGRAAFHLRAVGRDVIAALRLARETAVTEQKVMMIRIDNQAQQVTLSDDVGEGARSFALPGDVRIETVPGTLETQVVPVRRILFLPNGSAEDVEILLTAGTGASLKIVTDAVTGSARILSNQEMRVP